MELANSLSLGRVPRVVGTIITSEYLREWSDNPQPLPCDLMELRLDGFPDFGDWLRICKQIEQQGTPVFVTVRLVKEGGLWTRRDVDRWILLEQAIRELAGVDVEMRSDLARGASELCRELGKLCVYSFHDFKRTPPLSELEEILRTAERVGAIGKIAATAQSASDVDLLRSLLTRKWNVPICVIGMGPIARETRLKFPLEGSCFTYGYLDREGAPGQYSAAELTEYLRKASHVRVA